jgi:hypothetical protein
VSAEAVETAFAAAAGRIDGVRTALDHEPDSGTVMDLPAVTMWWTDVSQDDTETGPYTDNVWGWDINLYVPLELGFRDAQKTMRTLAARLLTVVRTDPALSGACDWLRISDGGPPVTAQSESTGYLHKTLRLAARTTER